MAERDQLSVHAVVERGALAARQSHQHARALAIHQSSLGSPIAGTKSLAKGWQHPRVDPVGLARQQRKPS